MINCIILLYLQIIYIIKYYWSKMWLCPHFFVNISWSMNLLSSSSFTCIKSRASLSSWISMPTKALVMIFKLYSTSSSYCHRFINFGKWLLALFADMAKVYLCSLPLYELPIFCSTIFIWFFRIFCWLFIHSKL